MGLRKRVVSRIGFGVQPDAREGREKVLRRQHRAAEVGLNCLGED
eukprot:SAG22_NODE_4239_length_1330_cov_3.306255_1_plen_45_part_00